jgi:Na+/phosphate symporter
MDSETMERRWGRWLDNPLRLFLLGLIVTSFTLSVSISLSVLVPLAGRGYVKREYVIPYIMGANIATFIDTLFASLLISAPVAFTIVLTEMLSVAAVSVLVLLLWFRPYRQALLAFNTLVTSSRAAFTVLVVLLAAVPLALVLL